MGIMEWKEEYSVGIKEIDQQHKVLFEMANKLYDAMKTGKGKGVLEELLKELVKYTMYHFSAEEALFSKYGFSKAEEHKKEHAELKTKVDKLLKDVDAGRTSITIDVFSFIKDWISVHILQKDKIYAAELADKVK